MAATPQYVAKIIYLPDMDQPMALTVSAGLLGTTTFSPSLQDGWMLTSMNGTVDSGGAAALQALASVASAAVGAGAGAATGGALHAGELGASPPNGNVPLLPPGLYGFDKAKGIYALTYFCSTGPVGAATGCPATAQTSEESQQQISNQGQVLTPSQSGPQQ